MTVALSGELDHTLESTSSEVRLLLPHDTEGYVTIDLSAAMFIDSSGIGFLLKLRRRCQDLGVTMNVINVPDNMMKTMRLAGVVEYLDMKSLDTHP